MERRKLLLSGTALIAALAGCSSSGGDPLPTTTTTAEPTATPTATPTPEEPTAEPTPTDTPEPTDTAEPTEEPTPAGSEAAAASIEGARQDLREAHEIYVRRSDESDPSLLDIDATFGFHFPSVTNVVRKAERKLNRAEREGSRAQRTTVSKLRGVALFLSTAARAQANVGRAYEEFADGADDLISGSDADAEIPAIESELQELDAHLTTLNEQSRASDFDAFDAISGSVMRRKIEQFERERSSLQLFVTLFADFQEGIEQYEDAESEYHDGDDDDAVAIARGVSDLFEGIVDEIDEAELADSVADVADAVRTEAENWVTRADDLADEAAA
ncbi:hypothetical protein SAMN04487949_1823 [Halogranum gelatinilyticum]|uniref:Uncharacterized protein n=1 Tax=Halogranum gelatinilyticum TaxID=660521 RepID=A0A1G9TLS3_9EURY|nr:hypothetical protein [Halogranum gelatinilyticum]SDM48620.1 hypothetical protein SAMN04487949_1823 [Halogranum gelatinilyticum]